jgi:hypothetical protein
MFLASVMLTKYNPDQERRGSEVSARKKAPDGLGSLVSE